MKLFTPKSWQILSTSLAHTKDTGIPYELELETVRKDGSNGWMWVRGETITDSQGKTTGLWGAAQDISERKVLEDQLRQSESRFRSMVESSPLGMYLYRLEGDDRLILETANASADRIIGIDHQNLLGLTIEDAFPNLAATEVPDLYRRIARGELGLQSFETPYQDDRFQGFYEVHVYQASPGFIAVKFLDITDRKAAEAERERLQIQLSQAHKMESVGRLAGGVAHDFNNMLGVILGHTEMTLSRVTPGTPLHDDLCEIQKAAERSAVLTRQLLAFARKQTVVPRVLHLNSAVEGMLTMLRRLIGEDINLTWLPGRDLGSVRMDPSQLDQIMANLCANARDAIADTGRVTIETENVSFDEAYCVSHVGFIPGHYTLIAVSDDGRGMDHETLSHIFEPFYTTKDTGKGTGLGLATVYGIVRQNNGFINVYSEPSHGTRFTIYLPRVLDLPAENPIRSPQKPPSPDATGRETLLLVEDEPAILKMTTLMLEALGYTVLPAATPGECLSLAAAHSTPVSLLLTDVVMPEMNGRDLARKIQKIIPGIQCLFLSGYTANVIAHHGVLDPGVHFIQKPFSMKALAAKLREVLDHEA
jgi:PAS domain S-box-containing protein